MQDIFDRYLDYLKAERNASDYTVRNYRSDLLGGKTEAGAKGFFQFLRQREIATLQNVDRLTLRGYYHIRGYPKFGTSLCNHIWVVINNVYIPFYG